MRYLLILTKFVFCIFSQLKETVSGMENQITNLESAQQNDAHKLNVLKSGLEHQMNVDRTFQQNDVSIFTTLNEELTKSVSWLEAFANPSMKNIRLNLTKLMIYDKRNTTFQKCNYSLTVGGYGYHTCTDMNSNAIEYLLDTNMDICAGLCQSNSSCEYFSFDEESRCELYKWCTYRRISSTYGLTYKKSHQRTTSKCIS